MSRYIDVDALIIELEKDECLFDKEAEEARNNPSAYTDGYADAMWSRANGIRDAIIEIYDAPSIDIVRCKECRHWNALDISRPSPCSVGLEDAKADDFCSYGQRKESE